MIEERALVLDAHCELTTIRKNIARVKVQRTSACESCSLKSGCGQRLLTKLSSNHCLELDVENTLNASPGDEVLIAIPEQGLLSASFRIYLLPLLMMLFSAMLMDSLFDASEVWVLFFAVVGLAVGFIWARVFSQKNALNEQFLPKITRVLISSPLG